MRSADRALVVAQHDTGLQLIGEASRLLSTIHRLHEREHTLGGSRGAAHAEHHACGQPPSRELIMVLAPPRKDGLRVITNVGAVDVGGQDGGGEVLGELAHQLPHEAMGGDALYL